jgi:hypothetical protein
LYGVAGLLPVAPIGLAFVGVLRFPGAVVLGYELGELAEVEP